MKSALVQCVYHVTGHDNSFRLGSRHQSKNASIGYIELATHRRSTRDLILDTQYLANSFPKCTIHFHPTLALFSREVVSIKDMSLDISLEWMIICTLPESQQSFRIRCWLDRCESICQGIAISCFACLLEWIQDCIHLGWCYRWVSKGSMASMVCGE